jgi:hypothetical protein
VIVPVQTQLKLAQRERLLEEKRNSAGLQHGTIISKVQKRVCGRNITNFMAQLDDGRKFILKRSCPPSQSDSDTPPVSAGMLRFHSWSRSATSGRFDFPALKIGDHVLVDADPRFCKKYRGDTASVARAWWPARPPGLESAVLLEEMDRGSETLARAGDGSAADEPAVKIQLLTEPRKTSFASMQSEFALYIEERVCGAVCKGNRALLLYDPLDSAPYHSIYMLVKGYERNGRPAPSPALASASGIDQVDLLMSMKRGENCSVRIIEFPSESHPGAIRYRHEFSGLTFVPINGLVYQPVSRPKKIESEILEFCLNGMDIR